MSRPEARLLNMPVWAIDEKCQICENFKATSTPRGELACEHLCVCMNALQIREKEGEAE